MKIAYLHQYFVSPGETGGVRSYTVSKGLVAAGHRVEVVTSSAFLLDQDLKEGWTELEYDGVIVHVYKLPYSNKMDFKRRLWCFVKFSIASCVKLAKIKPDLLYVTSTPLSVLVGALVLKFHKRVPYIFEVRDRWPEVPYKLGFIKFWPLLKAAQLLESLGYRYASHIVALSAGMATSIVKEFDVRHKLVVVENFCEIDIFSRDASSDVALDISAIPGMKVLYAGTLGLVNDVEYLIKLSVALKEQSADISIVIVGDGQCRSAAIELAERLGVLDAGIYFFLPVSKNKLASVYGVVDGAISTVIDNPVMWDNSANKFFDALAAGKPIFINHLGWQAKLIESAEVGAVLPVNEFKVAAKMVEKVLSEDMFDKRYSLRARDLAVRFSPEAQIPKITALVDRV